MAEQLRQFLRLKQVKVKAGLSRTAIYAKIKAGQFPRPYQLGARSVGWLSTDVEQWIDSLVNAAEHTK